MTIKNLTNEILLRELKKSVADEKKLIKKILEYLEEVESRAIYLKMAYSSMFAFCTEYLDYTAQEAQVRIQAMRLAKTVPEVKSQIETGSLSLTVAAKVQGHISRENKIKKLANQNKITTNETKAILDTVQNQSVRKSEILLFEIFPQHATRPPETTKPISSNTIRVEMNLAQETFEMLKNLQSLRAHAHSGQDFEFIMRDLCELGNKKWNPLAKVGSAKAERVLEPIH